MELKLDSSYKGTRILFGDAASKKRDMLDFCIKLLKSYEYKEVMIPILQLQETFAKKVGEENNNLMFNFKDRGDRDICLAPEYTAIVQQMAKQQFKYAKDVKMFYIGECFRGEKPQAGRYRQFTQFGVEIINPTKDYGREMLEIAENIISNYTRNYTINNEATRGLDYYVGGKGFEINCPELGAQNQICGGGSYPEGIGFAVGIDRLLLCK